MKQFNLDEYSKDPSKKIVTRDGRKVKIHCTNFSSDQPIIAEIEGINYCQSFSSDGKFACEESPLDLFFSSEIKVGWINIYVDSENDIYTGTCIYKSKEDGENFGKECPGYITTTKIEW